MTAALLVTPVRIALGCTVLIAARVAGAGSTAAALAFASLAGGTLFVIVNDPRRRFWRSRRGAPLPAPDDAHYLSRAELVRSAIFPSTVGVTVLAAVAIVIGRDTLAAGLAGVLAGMGLASLAAGVDLLLRERQTGCEYYAESNGNQTFERRRL
ncbi:MAG: hypothetical protein E6G02_00725 [Actinobacteria bacterium]|nr:MAG: hypothetical protein E6G02_00725 [Actinomycetota bacterium]